MSSQHPRDLFESDTKKVINLLFHLQTCPARFFPALQHVKFNHYATSVFIDLLYGNVVDLRTFYAEI